MTNARQREYALAAVVGAGLSLAAGWALARFLFGVPFAAEPLPLVSLAAAIALLCALVGLSGSREVFCSTRWRRCGRSSRPNPARSRCGSLFLQRPVAGSIPQNVDQDGTTVAANE